MPVPASYNDITQDPAIRDFIGWVWYERELVVPTHWIRDDTIRVVLRVGSAHYNSVVVRPMTEVVESSEILCLFLMLTISCHWCLQWVNGVSVTQHEGGHLPFEAEVSDVIRKDPTGSCRITIAVNNTLTLQTLPPGNIQYMNDRTRCSIFLFFFSILFNLTPKKWMVFCVVYDLFDVFSLYIK